jgi:hypothetical protein
MVSHGNDTRRTKQQGKEYTNREDSKKQYAFLNRFVKLRTRSHRIRKHHRTKHEGKLALLPHWEEEVSQEQGNNTEREKDRGRESSPEESDGNNAKKTMGTMAAM